MVSLMWLILPVLISASTPSGFVAGAEDCLCSRVYRPVCCRNNGELALVSPDVTFENVCWARCAGIAKCEQGACASDLQSSARQMSETTKSDPRVPQCNAGSHAAPTAPAHRHRYRILRLLSAVNDTVGDADLVTEVETVDHSRDGDNPEQIHSNVTSAGHGGGHGGHPQYHLVLLFMFVGVTLGAATQHILSRKFPSLPYTAVLLVEGIVIAIIHEHTDHGLGPLSDSINMWQGERLLLLGYVLPADFVLFYSY